MNINNPIIIIAAIIFFSVLFLFILNRKATKSKSRKKVKINTVQLDTLLSSLQDKNSIPQVKENALNTVRNARGFNRVYLLKAMEETDPEKMKEAATAALGRIKDRRAIDSLINTLRDRNFIRLSAIDALVKIGDPAVVPLINTLQNFKSDLREDAAEVPGKIGDKRAVFPLANCLKEKNIKLRIKSAQALGMIQDDISLPNLLDALADHNFNVRQTVIMALGNLGNKKALLSLFHSLNDQNSKVRLSAIWAVGKLGEGEITAEKALIKVLKDKNHSVRDKASTTLEKWLHKGEQKCRTATT